MLEKCKKKKWKLTGKGRREEGGNRGEKRNRRKRMNEKGYIIITSDRQKGYDQDMNGK